MKLSIIVPVYNEEQTITIVLESLKFLDLETWEKEVIVVNDGSKDKTRFLLEKFKRENNPANFIFLTHATNQGKGAAVKTGLTLATGNYVLVQDADLEYDLKDIALLLDKIISAQLAVVYGSRNLKPKRQGYRLYVFGVYVLTLLTNLLYQSKLTDVYTCYKLIQTSLFKSLELNSKGFGFEAEVTAKLLRKHVLIVEIPINYTPRSFAQGKKIRWSDGVQGIWILLKYRL